MRPLAGRARNSLVRTLGRRGHRVDCVRVEVIFELDGLVVSIALPLRLLALVTNGLGFVAFDASFAAS